MRVPKRRTKNRLEKTPQHLKSKIFPIKKSMANGPWGLGDANCALRKKRASCFTFVLECPPPACCLVAITANQNSATGNRGLVDWLLVGIPHPGQSGGGSLSRYLSLFSQCGLLRRLAYKRDESETLPWCTHMLFFPHLLSVASHEPAWSSWCDNEEVVTWGKWCVLLITFSLF